MQVYAYTRKQKHESLLLKEIEEKLKDSEKPKLTIGFANWFNYYHIKGYMPTTNKSIKQLLSLKFKVVLINEYNTNKISSICLEGKTKKFLTRLSHKSVRPDD